MNVFEVVKREKKTTESAESTIKTNISIVNNFRERGHIYINTSTYDECPKLEQLGDLTTVKSWVDFHQDLGNLTREHDSVYKYVRPGIGSVTTATADAIAISIQGNSYEVPHESVAEQNF